MIKTLLKLIKRQREGSQGTSQPHAPLGSPYKVAEPYFNRRVEASYLTSGGKNIPSEMRLVDATAEKPLFLDSARFL